VAYRWRLLLDDLEQGGQREILFRPPAPASGPAGIPISLVKCGAYAIFLDS
jgi:hypothetical protein